MLTLLDDPRDAVRAIAAGCLGDAAPPSAAATERLLALARDQAAAATVRQPALSSFARLVRSPLHAEAALELLLDEAAPYSEFQRVAWLVDVGRVLVLAPRSDAGRRALALLRDRSAPPPDGDVVEGDEALVAASVLARVAAVERTAAPDPALVARLHAGVATFLPDHGDPDAFDGHAAALQPMLEALVDLATWPGSGVAVADVRAALTNVAAHGDAWLREWAAEQLRRLP